jgi:LPXTG-motif cell wall-anchored protein
LAYTGFNWALFSIAAALAILGLAAYYVRRRLTS